MSDLRSKNRITGKAMAAELAKVLHCKSTSVQYVISGVKNGKDKNGAADLVLAVKISIIKKYHDKCGGLFR